MTEGAGFAIVDPSAKGKRKRKLIAKDATAHFWARGGKKEAKPPCLLRDKWDNCHDFIRHGPGLGSVPSVECAGKSRGVPLSTQVESPECEGARAALPGMDANAIQTPGRGWKGREEKESMVSAADESNPR